MIVLSFSKLAFQLFTLLLCLSRFLCLALFLCLNLGLAFLFCHPFSFSLARAFFSLTSFCVGLFLLLCICLFLLCICLFLLLCVCLLPLRIIFFLFRLHTRFHTSLLYHVHLVVINICRFVGDISIYVFHLLVNNRQTRLRLFAHRRASPASSSSF